MHWFLLNMSVKPAVLKESFPQIDRVITDNNIIHNAILWSTKCAFARRLQFFLQIALSK